MPAGEKDSKDKQDEKSLHEKNDIKIKQGGFINEVEQTENLIDPGNEHHHSADDADKKNTE